MAQPSAPDCRCDEWISSKVQRSSNILNTLYDLLDDVLTWGKLLSNFSSGISHDWDCAPCWQSLHKGAVTATPDILFKLSYFDKSLKIVLRFDYSLYIRYSLKIHRLAKIVICVHNIKAIMFMHKNYLSFNFLVLPFRHTWLIHSFFYPLLMNRYWCFPRITTNNIDHFIYEVTKQV